MSKRYPVATVSVEHAIKVSLRVVKRDIKRLGHSRAYELFMSRSIKWIQGHDGVITDDRDEAVAIAAFSAALSFINVLFATGEIDNGG